MELNGWTFIFEIINFLILIWILHRFLYRPVLEVIARRRQNIEQTLANAQALRDEAQSLQTEYQNRLLVWEKEKRAARAALQGEIDAERSQRLKELEKDLEQEREKALVVKERTLREALQRNQQTALEQGSRFAARLLRRIASPALHARLVELTLDELARLPPERVLALRSAFQDEHPPPKIASAYALDAAAREALQTALARLAGRSEPWTLVEDGELIAGLRITIGPWTLHANLRDELKSFADAAAAG